MKNAKVVIAVCVERKIASEIDKQNSQRMELIDWLARHEQYTYSAAFAMQNMWLAAWELGVGVCCVTLDRDSAYKLLEIPQDQEVVASLAMGRILGNPVPHKDADRKPLSEMVYFEKYGVKDRDGNF